MKVISDSSVRMFIFATDDFLFDTKRIKLEIMIQPEWKTVKEFEDITYKKYNGVARIAFNRPNVRNAFRPKTTKELYEAFYDAGEDTSIGVVLLSAEGPSTKDGVYSFCSGGDQKSTRSSRLCWGRWVSQIEYFGGSKIDSFYAKSCDCSRSWLGSWRRA